MTGQALSAIRANAILIGVAVVFALQVLVQVLA